MFYINPLICLMISNGVNSAKLPICPPARVAAVDRPSESSLVPMHIPMIGKPLSEKDRLFFQAELFKLAKQAQLRQMQTLPPSIQCNPR